MSCGSCVSKEPIDVMDSLCHKCCAKNVFYCVLVHFISLFFCRNTKDTESQRTGDAMKKEASGII